MTGFEPRTSGIGSNRSTNWATTTSPGAIFFLHSNLLAHSLPYVKENFYNKNLRKMFKRGKNIWAFGRRIKKVSPAYLGMNSVGNVWFLVIPRMAFNIDSSHFWDRVIFKKKWANPSLFFIYFRLFKHTFQFLQQINVKNVHPLFCAGIWTHNLWNRSLLP